MIRSILPAAALPLLVTAVTLSGAAWNRSGGRGPTELTHRELPAAGASPDNSARTLRIQYAGSWFGGLEWLTAERLGELGFDTRLDPASPDADRHYGRALPRVVYVALEFNGPAWEAWLRSVRNDKWAARRGVEREREMGSRLVPVDAAIDATTLEARYPDPSTHVIARGVVRIFVYKPEGGRARVVGVVEGLAPAELHVPKDLAARVSSPSYRVRIQYGRRYEPWIVGIEP
jgi:hypothetical protein